MLEVGQGLRVSNLDESLNCEKEVSSIHEGEKLGNKGSLSLSSSSRTKTAQLSGNGYSEEVAKLCKIGLTARMRR